MRVTIIFRAIEAVIICVGLILACFEEKLCKKAVVAAVLLRNLEKSREVRSKKSMAAASCILVYWAVNQRVQR